MGHRHIAQIADTALSTNLNVCPFDYTAFAVSWGPVNQLNHTSLVAFVTPTDRPKSVRNRRVIEFFGGVCVLSPCFLGLNKKN